MSYAFLPQAQLWPLYFCLFLGEAHSLQVESILFKGKSEYQEVVVFEVYFISHTVPYRIILWFPKGSIQRGN